MCVSVCVYVLLSICSWYCLSLYCLHRASTKWHMQWIRVDRQSNCLNYASLDTHVIVCMSSSGMTNTKQDSVISEISSPLDSEKKLSIQLMSGSNVARDWAIRLITPKHSRQGLYHVPQIPQQHLILFYSSLHRIRPWWSFWCVHSGYRHQRGLRPQGPHENSNSTRGPQRHGPERDVIRQELRYDRRHVLMHRMRHRISTLPPCCSAS